MIIRELLTPNVKRLWRPYRTSVVIGSTALVLVDLIDIGLPLIMKGAFDSFGNHAELRRYALGYACLLGIQAMLRLVYRTLLPIAKCRFAHALRVDLASKLLGTPTHASTTSDTGRAATLITSDVDQSACLVDDGVIVGFDAALYLLFIPPMMLFINPLVAIASAAPLMAIPFLTKHGENVIKTVTEQVQHSLSAISTFLDEALRNHETLRVFSQRERVSTFLETLSTNQLQRVIAATHADATLSSRIQFCGSVSMTILLLCGGYSLHERTLSVGAFVALFQYLQQLFWPLLALGFWISMAQKAHVSSRRLEDIVSSAPTQSQSVCMPPSTEPPLLSIERVSIMSHAQPGPIVDDVSFTIQPGERVAVCGPTGSGKTSLLEGIAGLRPIHGSVVLGAPLEDIPTKHAITFCLQVSRLFSDTIENNLLFWNKEPLRSAVSQELLEDLFSPSEMTPDGDVPFLQRRVNDQSGLSGGQRQRITLARTLLSTAPIVLLDNPLSAVDPEREALIVSRLSHWVGERSLVMVTNRLAPLQLVDRVIVLVDGRIVQDGAIPELLADEAGWFAGFYRRLSAGPSSAVSMGNRL